MAATLQLQDILRCRFYCKSGLQISVNGLDYQVKQLDAPCTDLETAIVIHDLFSPLFKAAIGSNATVEGLSMSTYRGNALFYETSVGLSSQGLGGAVMMPKQTAGLIRKYTDRAGRAYRGRMYVPFPGVVSPLTGNVPPAAVLAAYGALAAQMHTPITTVALKGVSIPPVIIHKNSVANPPTGILTCVAQALWATQRRRGDYGRTNVLPVLTPHP